MRTLPAAAALLTLTTTLALTGCGSSSSGGTTATNTQPTAAATTPSTPAANATAPADVATATADVKSVYSHFFSSPIPKAKTLLEDGSTLSAAFKVAAKAKGSAKEKAKVDSVAFTSATAANVKYALLSQSPGQSSYSQLLPPTKGQFADGQAVLVNGKWVVAKATFCGLVSLINGKSVAGC
jgi:hypothetical protein